MRGLPVLIPHRAGCADFPLPVLHGRASLTVVQMTLSVTRRQRSRTVRPRFHSFKFSYPLSFRGGAFLLPLPRLRGNPPRKFPHIPSPTSPTAPPPIPTLPRPTTCPPQP